ncbi:MAG: hypothetical protein AAFP97_07445, partial [Pseudomonadota bacterium]
QKRKRSAFEIAPSMADFHFCASDHSLESSWANVEVQKAVSFNVPLLCVAVSKCDLSSLPPQLKELQAIEVWRFPAGSILKSTVKEIEAVLALRYLITPKSRSVTQKGVSYVVHSPSMNDVGLDDLFVDLTKPDKNIEIIKWPEPEHIMEWLLETSALNGDIVLRLGPKEELFEEFILGSIVSGLGSRLLKIEDYSEGRTRSNLLQLDLIVDFQSRL